MPTYQAPGVYVEEVPSSVQPIAGVSTSVAGFIGIIPDQIQIPERNPDYDPTLPDAPLPKPSEPADTGKPADPVAGTGATGPSGRTNKAPNSPYRLFTSKVDTPALQVRLCTSFGDFKRYFATTDSDRGAFSTDSGQNTLAHAVFGFFANGGSLCYVVRIKDDSDFEAALEKFEAVDEISIVAAPGMIDDTVRAAIVAHCEKMKDRFAIFDGPREVTPTDAPKILPAGTKNGAFYHPWIKVADLAEKIQHPKDKGIISLPPSGHVAGVYARVDTERGVHKAPANEIVLDALGLESKIGKNEQMLLNPQGINCIRDINRNIRIWGARTVGGDLNFEYKYVNVRRVLLYLRKSIDLGTQWVVFEPNDLKLWGKIVRNITAFLTNVWRDGALFGATPQEAFYVKCDADTNPPEVRELGMVVTEIGVAIVRPAEFVIFRIQQWQPEKKQ